MISRFRFWGGLGCGLVAAIWWAVGMVFVQPAVEPITYAENNTYWLRDVRWLALLAVALAFVWTVRGDRRLTLYTAAAYVAAIGADLLLDRLDHDTAPVVWGVRLIVIVVPGAWILARGRRITPSPRTAMVAAVTAAVGAGVAAILESPTDREWYLAASALLLSALLIVVGFGNAHAAAKRWGRGEWWIAALVGSGIVALDAFGRFGPLSGGTALSAIVSLVSAVGAVTLLATAGRWSPQTRIVAAGFLGAGGLVVVLVAVVAVAVTGAADTLTALVGNPAVNPADEDLVLSLTATIAGLALGLILAAVDRGAASPRREPTLVATPS